MPNHSVSLDRFDEIPQDEDGFTPEDAIASEDCFYRLSNRKLEIKCYFFPSRQSRFINLREITAVYFRLQSKGDLLSTKMWGMYGTRVWWASDMKRGLRSKDSTLHTNVVVDCGERMLKGFTVSDFDVFRQALEKCTNGITFIETLPQSY